jgi:chromosome segregation ATPase
LCRSSLVTDQVAELESTIESLKGQLEEESSAADDAISQWQESYTALEVRRSELETQLETLRMEKEEMRNTETSSNTVDAEELRSEKDKLERMLQERDEALAAAREDLKHDAEVVHEWEGKLLERCTLFYKSADTEIVFDADACRLSCRVDQVAELESTIESLERHFEEQSSAADDAILQWQESYTALEVRSSELESQLETLTNEKEELLKAETSSSAIVVEELRSEKDRLEQELQESNEALAAAREGQNQDADVAHEWEGKLLEDCTFFWLSVAT